MAKDFWVSDYALREDHFGMVFSGNIMIPEDGLYVFRSNSDDACMLYVDGELLVDQDGFRELNKEVGAIALKKGFHPISIHFMERIGRERLRLYMKGTYDPQWEALEFSERLFH